MVILLIISDPMRGLRRNKENNSVDLLDNTHVDKKRWGLVFYGVKSNIISYYRRGLKDLTASLTLNALGNFIAEHGIPRMIIMDSDGLLSSGKKWKHYLGLIFTPFDYPNQINKIRIQSNVRYKT